MKKDFIVKGMSCAACVSAVERSVQKLPGVDSVSVSLLTNSMQVEYDPEQSSVTQIIAAVEKAGYSASEQIQEINEHPSAANEQKGIWQEEIQSLKQRFWISLLFLIPLMYIAMGPMVGLPTFSIFEGSENAVIFAFSQMLLALPILIVNRKYFTSGFKALFHKNPNMDSLVAIGSSAAFSYGIFVIYMLAYATGHNLPEITHQYLHSLYFESAAMILTLVTLGKSLEAKSKGKTTDAITKLMDLRPKTAILLKDGSEQEIPLEAVKEGDILLVKPGSAIPIDGTVIAGNGLLDESAITGESIPVEKGVGSQVIGATLLTTGSIQIRADRVGENTTLAKIIHLMQETISSKAPISKLADRISAIFVPTVIGLAILTIMIWLLLGYDFEFALSLGISVLIISCPCALGLATPVAIMVATGKGAANGILIKSAEALETLHEVQSVVLDKTGTITEGNPRLTDIVTLCDLPSEKFLQIAASLEAPSEHPLSIAILEYAKMKEIRTLPIEDFKNILGKGIQGKIQQQFYYAGNQKYMEELGFSLKQIQEKADRLSAQGKTALFFADEQGLIGYMAVADPIKKNSREAIALLHQENIKVCLLSGDHQRTADAIARQLEIDHVVAEVLPDEKEKIVRQFQEEQQKVAMVGDGINDAPALVRADVGIAIGAGTDIAIEAADIVLMKSDLMDVVNSIALSKKTIRNIKQNLFWAFFYNILCIPLAAGVFYLPFNILLNPMIASAAMSLSSVFVVTNALRLNRFKAKKPVSMSDEIVLPDTIHEEINHSENKKIISDQKGKNTMHKIIKIEGMTCAHCKARVEKTLQELGALSVVVDLENKQADLISEKPIDDVVIKNAIHDAGYEVLEIIQSN